MNRTHPLSAVFGIVSLSMAHPLCQARDWVVVYPSYSRDGGAIVEGRITEHEKRSAPTAEDRRRDNFRRNVDLLSNNERVNSPVTVRLGSNEWQTVTDAEGYFRIEMSGLGHSAGWHPVVAHSQDAVGEAGILFVPAEDMHGIISDVDDTIQITEVNSKRRMLSNTLLLNPLQRKAVPGIVAFYRELVQTNPQPEVAPVFYLSASPRQLHESIAAFLDRNQFPRGVLITKRVTNDATSEPLTDQFTYKTAKIEDIFARLPLVRFTLVGDDGEQDPEIFSALRLRYPDRIDAIWIHRVNPDHERAQLPDQGNLNERLRLIGDRP